MDVPVKKALAIAPNDWDANRMAAARLADSALDDRMYEFARKCYATSPGDPWAPYPLALLRLALAFQAIGRDAAATDAAKQAF
jgi:hypothetical protein